MTQQLYLLRHAEADPWSPLGNDFSRALNRKGKQHASLVSEWIRESLPQVNTILCSPAKRTRETLAPILAGWPKLLANTDYVDSMYNASLNMLLTLAEDAFTYSERLLMIGHNPGVGELLINLLGRNQQTGMRAMSTGNMAVIEFPAGFRRDVHDGNLLHLIRREHLSDH